MRFSLATNFDNRLIEEIAPLGTIDNVYGKFSADMLGGGRPSYLLPKVSYKRLQQHIDLCHKHGIKFNYLFNSMCSGNLEVTKAYNKIFRYIDKVIGTGVDSVTIANTNFLRMFRKNYPEIPVSISLFAGVNSLYAIRKMEEEGVREITLSTDLNRDLKYLKELIGQIKPQTSLRLVANNVCLHRCIDNKSHSNYGSHCSQSKHFVPAYLIDPYKLKCDYEKMVNPTMFISSDWIRPEDIPVYDEISRDRLIIKLTDRSSTTDWLIRVATAYTTHKTGGNLMNLLNFSGNRKVAHINTLSVLRGIIQGNASIPLVVKFIKSISLIPVYIDSAQLDGFLKGMQDIDCQNRICNDKGWMNNSSSGDGCSYCRRFAERAVKINETERLELIAFMKKLLDDLYSGKFW
jgi:collagenase-like PrtC family protease